MNGLWVVGEQYPWVTVMLIRRVCLHLGRAEDDIPFTYGLHGVFICRVNGCLWCFCFYNVLRWVGSSCGVLFIILSHYSYDIYGRI